jgi:acyl-CoA-dependent ceramide synthase
MNLEHLWTDWPNRELPGLTKTYLLAQLSFWLQQIMVINIEERRKDHWQMFSHHIITSSLIIGCYVYHQTRVGILILVLMDVVDLFLPVSIGLPHFQFPFLNKCKFLTQPQLAKCLKYCGYTTICDILFGIFMISWFMARHVFYMMVCWSIYSDTPHSLMVGCFTGSNDNLVGPMDPPDGLYYLLEPLINASGQVCYDDNVKWAFLTPLLLLQVITIVWFTMVIRVAVKVLRGDGAEDTRSDDEAVDEEEEEELEDDAYFYEEAQPLEEEVGAESLDLKNWERRTGIKRQASSSGVSLPGHSDRKELLGRIGCEKQVE